MIIDFITVFFKTLYNTVWDVLPILVIIFGFQFLVVRRKMPHLGRVLVGFVMVLIGLSFFLVGLEQALFPIGELMAKQLTSLDFIRSDPNEVITWKNYVWVYAFAAAIGASTAIAEPSLMAVAIKANDVSGGAIHPWGLRVAVSIGVAIGISLGTFRIVTGLPLHWFIIGAYVILITQTIFSPKMIIPLAFDTGGVTTSTVTVPLVSALGVGLASTVPGRSVLIDGFGLIAFACLFPIMTVLGYAQLSMYLQQRKDKAEELRLAELEQAKKQKQKEKEAAAEKQQTEEQAAQPAQPEESET